ncbi:NAD-dependent succinate-semialdehyde dehydrogenase [Variovorax sp. H27-G14]|uniref:NAD-dependent succinate-semialdehyde dehydrogenase n=1 Tax=Variovorax sp. H27-G14 TaxID=3111914 RepID=UPI0038FC451C
MTSPDYPDTLLMIDGEWQPAADGNTMPVLNPATGQVIGHVACAGIADLERAVQAAHRGFGLWRAVPAIQRAATLRKAASLLRERAASIAHVLTTEQGKPLSESTMEVQSSADVIDWFADEGLRIYGRIVPPRNPAMQQFVTKEPVGPVAAFTPWNYPINQIVRKLSAALASGCSMLVKAPEETPASAAALLQAFVDAGVPAGAVGVVFGDPAQISDYLIAHPLIRKITFTGSTGVGKQLAAMAGQHMKRVSMELGGHAPVIVASDANVALAAHFMGPTKFHNAGQACVSPTRFLVHNSLRDAFEGAMVAYAKSLKPGDGLTEGTTLGPLANARRVAAMERVVEDAVRCGATLAAGGRRLDMQGNFFEPTVLTDVPLQADVFNNEPFGPVAAIRGFDDIEEAVAEANRLPYGLGAYAFTQSISHARRISQALEAGMVWINQPPTPFPEMPFGGVKDSGYGSEGGPEALEAYLVTKAVSIMSL